jgi:hypothetical protein
LASFCEGVRMVLEVPLHERAGSPWGELLPVDQHAIAGQQRSLGIAELSDVARPKSFRAQAFRDEMTSGTMLGTVHA